MLLPKETMQLPSTTKQGNILVMQKLGCDVNKLFTTFGRTFTKETVSKIGIAMIEHIEYLHFHGFLHLDIKPHNFVIGALSSYTSEEDFKKHDQNIFMIDLGLCRSWRNADGSHIHWRDGVKLSGC